MKNSFLMTGLHGLIFGFVLSAAAQTPSRLVSDIDRRLGPRTTFQKPIAYDIADHTVLLEGAVFSGGTYLFDSVNSQGLVQDTEGWDGFYGGIVDLRIARKMGNALSYGIDGRTIFEGTGSSDFTFEDTRFDIYLRGRYGQISYGDFDDRNALLLSSRSALSGEATLFYDGFFNPPGGKAFRYRGRFSSFLVDAAVDDNGENYNIGFLYRSPTATKKDSWSLDYHGGDYLERYARNGVTAGYDIAYGSWDFKVAASWDQFDPYADFDSFDRISASFCASYKFQAFTWSAGLMLSETNGGDLETTYTAGIRYDMARGLSLNTGYFYIDSDSIGTDGNPIAAGNFSGMRSSISYRF
ncbi:MAG: hypothetical protein P1U68_17480 [Verrucomicrobiales bacterium]|nr:hypothetical protein [Verrucomicrobiales bacterium]